MEPVVKKRFLEDIRRNYSTMDARKKKELLFQPSEKFFSLLNNWTLDILLNEILGLSFPLNK